MKKTSFLRDTIVALLPCVCLLGMAPAPATAQQSSMGAHFQPAVYDGSNQAGWYSFPGQQPELSFKHHQVRITSRQQSTILLSGADAAGSTAEVSLARPPASTSSISGLAVLTDASHAMVIGLEGGDVVLWKLDPVAARIVARHPVNGNAPLEFRVTGGTPSDVRFFWRHPGDSSWHALGNAATDHVLIGWNEPLRFGLLLDGPQGSQVTFSNYHAGSAGMASVAAAPGVMTASLVGAR